MTQIASRLVCSGCGASPEPREPYPFRCPKAGDDDVDHVLVRVLDPPPDAFPSDDDPDPFIRYRSLLHSYHLATAAGMSDAEFRAVVTDLEDAVAAVDGHGFVVTPFARSDALSAELGFSDAGGVWVKDETGNVAGSHKARHLMGLLVHLEVVERIGLVDPTDRPDLAIASCGNAALAAAVVAAAGKRRLRVFVPPDADAVVVRRLADLGADVEACPRQPGVPGDPTYHRLKAALAAGALPFTCQGNENGLAIEGGLPLGYEIADALAAAGVELDAVVVQVGGGALASAVIQGLREAEQLGRLARLPAVHTVQTTGAHPLERAYHRVRSLLDAPAEPADVERALGVAAGHRAAYMWPWEDEPKSVAHGILDDETYDWVAVVRGMLQTGGRPLVVSEEQLLRANELANSVAGVPADETGSAGLAGLLALRDEGVVGPDARAAVLFTGVRR